MNNGTTLYPLTSAQKSILIIDKFYPETSYVNLVTTIIIKGQIDYALLNQAINLVIKKNEVLRTRVVNDDSGETVQYFSEHSEGVFDVLNFSHPKDIEYQHWSQNRATSPFSLYNSNLYYFAVINFGPNEGGVFVKCHHIVMDFWSMILLVNQIVENYKRLTTGLSPEMEIHQPYTEFIIKEQNYLSSSRFLNDKDYWNGVIEKIPNPHLFKKRETYNIKARRIIRRLPPNISQHINDLCTEFKVSPFILFCAALSIYFWKKQDIENIVIGTTVLNRVNHKEKNAMGALFNNLPFLIELKPSLNFTEYLVYLNSEWLKLLRHSRYPYVNILKDYREFHKVKHEVFDLTLTYLHGKFDATDFEVNPPFNGEEVNTLRMNINDMKGIGQFHIDYDYSIEVLTEDEIETINNCFTNLIENSLNRPEQRLSEISMLSNSERELIVNQFNRTEMAHQPERTILHLFQEVKNRVPENIALVFENKSLTYKEVNDQSNHLARYLQKKGVAKEEIVGISVNRSFDLVIGLLGILKAGAAFLPIDPNYPKERIAYMLGDSGCRFLLTNNSAEYDDLISVVEKIDLSTPEIREESAGDLAISTIPSDLAYVIYTSGSTGLPKGVMIEHKALSNFVHAITNEVDIYQRRVLSLTTMSFDIFFLETLLPLLIGNEVVIANNDEQNNPSSLANLIEWSNVEVLQATPSRTSTLINNNSSSLKNLAVILVGGEVFPQSLLFSLKAATNAKIYNMYGPTETTIWSLMKNLNDTDQITIGKPIGNTKVYILDQCYMPVPIGMHGEIFIAGDGLARGYLHRPKLTEERFIPNPFIPGKTMYKTGDIGMWLRNGEIEYIGRNDNQVKVRGFRIELGEIEKSLLKINQIKQAVVTAKQSNSDRAYLCAYLVGNEELSISDLRKALSTFLPDYMIPNRFVWLPALPLTPNGKIDRKSLPNPDRSEENSPQSFVPARDNIEHKLADIWSNVLEVDKVGIDDNFFELGGDSLAILEVLSSTLPDGWRLSAQEFYEYPTIRELSKIINERCDMDSKIESKDSKKHPDTLNNLKGYYSAQESVYHGNILLTGATGYLGVHILIELLNKHPGKVYCLIRGMNYEKRFMDLLQYYIPQFPSDLLNRKVILLNGDISQKQFGLSEDEYNNLACNVTSVIHSAAKVNHFGVYSDFEKTNIIGTEEIIHFCQRFQKHLGFISTISVSGNYLSDLGKATTSFTENDLYIGQDYQSNVYVKSKFEAERLIINAVKNGLKATIFRVGILTGRFSDGQFQSNILENAFYRKLKSIFTLQCLPEHIFEEFIEFTPVDSCAKAIVLILETSCERPLVFHLFNHKMIKAEYFLKVLENYGINIKRISLDEFKNMIFSLSQTEKGKEIISGFVTDVTMKGYLTFSSSIEIDSKQSNSFLKNLGFEWPDLDEEYLRKIINHMKQVSFLQDISS